MLHTMPSLSSQAVKSTSMRHSGLSLVALALSLALAGCAGHNSSNGNNVGSNAPSSNGQIGPNTLNVADAAIAGGDPTMALSVSQSILANDPNNVDALVHEGQAYYALNRCPAAEAAFQQALRGDPKSADAQTGLGRCLLRVDPPRAEAAFLAATQADPGNAAAFSDLGISRDLQNNFAGAAQAYQQSLTINAGSTATSVNLGLSLALSGQGAEALQYLGPIATGPEATAKIREDYAVALVSSGRPDDARNVLAVDMTPDQVNAAMAAFQALLSTTVTSPAAPAPVATTQPQLQTTPVSVEPMAAQYPSAPVMLAPSNSGAGTTASNGAGTTTVVEESPAARPAAPPPPVYTPVVSAPVPAKVTSAVPPASATITPVPSSAVPAPVAASYTPPAAPAAKSSTSKPATRTASVAAPAPVQPEAAPYSAPYNPADNVAPAAVSTASSNQAAAAPAPVSTNSSHAAVQIAALNSAEAAHAEWRLVSSKAPSLFSGKAPDISKVAVGGQTYYRLRVTGFASHEDAVQFCAQITANGGTCMPANF